MFNEKQKKPFVSLRFIIRIITQITVVTAASLAQAIKARNGAGLDLFCHDTGSIQGPLLLFFSFSLAISQTKTSI